MFADEYEDKIKQTFLGNPYVFMTLSLGIKKKAYEFRTNGCGDFAYDFFFMYKVTEQKYCTYYHVDKIIRYLMSVKKTTTTYSLAILFLFSVFAIQQSRNFVQQNY